MAAPLMPIEGETFEGNIARAKRWYRQLCLAFPSAAFTAPWILNCEMFDESEENRRAGMERNAEWIRRCDELFLVGPRVSSGMKAEVVVAAAAGKSISRIIPVRALVEGESFVLIPKAGPEDVDLALIYYSPLVSRAELLRGEDYPTRHSRAT